MGAPPSGQGLALCPAPQAASLRGGLALGPLRLLSLVSNGARCPPSEQAPPPPSCSQRRPDSLAPRASSQGEGSGKARAASLRGGPAPGPLRLPTLTSFRTRCPSLRPRPSVS